MMMDRGEMGCFFFFKSIVACMCARSYGKHVRIATTETELFITVSIFQCCDPFLHQTNSRIAYVQSKA